MLVCVSFFSLVQVQVQCMTFFKLYLYKYCTCTISSRVLPCYIWVIFVVDFFVCTCTVPTLFHQSGFLGTYQNILVILLEKGIPKIPPNFLVPQGYITDLVERLPVVDCYSTLVISNHSTPWLL